MMDLKYIFFLCSAVISINSVRCNPTSQCCPQRSTRDITKLGLEILERWGFLPTPKIEYDNSTSATVVFHSTDDGQDSSITEAPVPAMGTLLHDVDVETKKATFAMGCFWEPDVLFGSHKGVIRTRVGYTGGTKKDPTYKSLGDHTEAIDVDYNPADVKYEELLDIFWSNHDPSVRMTRQYSSFIYYHDDDQKILAEKSLEEKKAKGSVLTKIVPASEFYEAEGYHQKYRLQQHPWLVEAIGLSKGDQKSLIRSHIAARLNGYIFGRGGREALEEDIKRLGLNDQIAEYVRKYYIKFEGRGLAC